VAFDAGGVAPSWGVNHQLRHSRRAFALALRARVLWRGVPRLCWRWRAPGDPLNQVDGWRRRRGVVLELVRLPVGVAPFPVAPERAPGVPLPGRAPAVGVDGRGAVAVRRPALPVGTPAPTRPPVRDPDVGGRPPFDPRVEPTAAGVRGELRPTPKGPRREAGVCVCEAPRGPVEVTPPLPVPSLPAGRLLRRSALRRARPDNALPGPDLPRPVVDVEPLADVGSRPLPGPPGEVPRPAPPRPTPSAPLPPRDAGEPAPTAPRGALTDPPGRPRITPGCPPRAPGETTRPIRWRQPPDCWRGSRDWRDWRARRAGWRDSCRLARHGADTSHPPASASPTPNPASATNGATDHTHTNPATPASASAHRATA